MSPSEESLSRANGIVPLSNVYFRDMKAWPGQREELVRLIAETIDEAYLPGLEQGRKEKDAEIKSELDIQKSLDKLWEDFNGQTFSGTEDSRSWFMNRAGNLVLFALKSYCATLSKTLESSRQEIERLKKDGHLICQDMENDVLKKENSSLRDEIASAADLGNTWAREFGVAETSLGPYSGLELRNLIDRLWIKSAGWVGTLIKSLEAERQSTRELVGAAEVIVDLLDTVDNCLSCGKTHGRHDSQNCEVYDFQQALIKALSRHKAGGKAT